MSRKSTLLEFLDRIPVFPRYLTYMALMGSITAISQFGVVIARKSLGADEFTVTLIAMAAPTASITSLWWAKLITGRDQRKLILIFGSLGILALASGAFLHHAFHIIAIHFLWFLVFSLIRPAESRVLQQHIAGKSTGKTYGMGASLRLAVVAVVSGGAGLWMNYMANGFRNLYPMVALLGFAAILLLSSIRTSGDQIGKPLPIGRKLFTTPLVEMVQLLKRRKDFLRFEIAFMLFGGCFMMTTPVVPLYLVDTLELGYDTIGLARGTLAQITMMVVMQGLGRVFDRSTPHRLGVVFFCAMALYPALLLLAGEVEGTLRMALIYVSFAYFGVIMSGVEVLWQLSSIRFSQGEDVGLYQSVHVAATGLRGLTMPLTGFAIMTMYGKTAALMTAAVGFFAAGLLLALMRYIDIRKGENVSLRV